LALRLRVRVARGKLDRQIAAGHSCDSIAALALRARQLVHPRARQSVAGDLRRIVGYVDRVGLGPVLSTVMIERAAVRDGREAILGLADRLDGTAPVSPAGVALALMLVSDGRYSPILNRYCERSVSEAVWEVADALGAEVPTIRFDAVAHE
jgi:hypothetical protein